MRDDTSTAGDRNNRIESFAAEITNVIYPLVLRGRPKGSWIQVELQLWNRVREAVRNWAERRPANFYSMAWNSWGDSLRAALTECALRLAAENEVRGNLRVLQRDVSAAIGLAIGLRGGVPEAGWALGTSVFIPVRTLPFMTHRAPAADANYGVVR